MRKLDLINEVAKTTGMHKVDVLVVYDEIVKQIIGNVMIGNNVSLRNFGTFKPNVNKANEYTPLFVPSEKFKHIVAVYLNE